MIEQIRIEYSVAFPCAVLVAWTSFVWALRSNCGQFWIENKPVSSALSPEEKSNTPGMEA
jgi:hypothetical protein